MDPETKEKPEIKEEISKVETSEKSGEEIIPDIIDFFKFAEDFQKQMNESLTKLIGKTLEEIPKEKTSEENVEEGKVAKDFKKQMNEGLKKLIEMTSLKIRDYKKWVDIERNEKTEGIRNANKSTMEKLMAPLTLLYNMKDTKDEEIISIKTMFNNFCINESITVILPSVTEDLNENLHHAAETEETEDEQKDNKIASVIRIGCQDTLGNVIVPADVIVYKKKKIDGE